MLTISSAFATRGDACGAHPVTIEGKRVVNVSQKMDVKCHVQIKEGLQNIGHCQVKALIDGIGLRVRNGSGNIIDAVGREDLLER